MIWNISRFKPDPGHKSPYQAVHRPVVALVVSFDNFFALGKKKVKQRQRGDKRHRHESGLLKVASIKLVSLVSLLTLRPVVGRTLYSTF